MKNKKIIKKEKAFTLIELLAVLVILAIIALIAVPIILGIVNQARKDAFVRSTELVVSSTDIDMAVAAYAYGHTYTMTDGKIEDLKIGIQNTKGMSGTITYGTDGIAEYALHNNAWCVKKTKAMEKAEVTEYKEEDCVIEVEPPVVATNEECFTFDEDLKATLNYTVGDNCPTDVVIPSTIKGIPVEKIGLSTEEFNQLKEEEKFTEKCGERGKNCDDFMLKGITSVIIPNGVKSIGAWVFTGNQLTSVEIPSSVTSIGDYAFCDNQLTSIEIPSSVTSIGNSAFSSNQLTRVEIPSSVKSIGASAFWGNQLTSIEIPSSVTSIGEDAFYGNQLTSIEIPSSVTSIGKSAFNNNQLPDEQAFIYARGEDGREDKTTIVSYGGAKRDNVKIPSGVTSIGEYAFWDNQLTSVEIPSSVTSIWQVAFMSNQLTSVVIHGKSSSADFIVYYYPWEWADGYNDENIIWCGATPENPACKVE